MQSLGVELTNMSQAVMQIRQDIHMNKLDIDHIAEQSRHHMDLAQRLHVTVESAVDTEFVCAEGEDGGAATLSVNRVQVMIAAAARQLVAGSKWVTKETFDTRVMEVRKEYLTTQRQIREQVEDLFGEVQSVRAASQAALQRPTTSQVQTPRLPRMAPSGHDRVDVSEWPEDYAAGGSHAEAYTAGGRPGVPGSHYAGSRLGSAPASVGGSKRFLGGGVNADLARARDRGANARAGIPASPRAWAG